MSGGLRLTPQEVKTLVSELERRLDERGVQASIVIFGGAAMALRFPDDPDVRTTSDIDAVYEPIAEVEEVVADMARDFELPDRWRHRRPLTRSASATSPSARAVGSRTHG